MSASASALHLARFAGVFGLTGCCLFAAAVLVGDFLISGSGFYADTISSMAAGPRSWIVDFGIIVYAASFQALALGAVALHPGGIRWSVGCVGLLALGLVVFLVGFRNEYGDSDREASENIHIYLVYALGALFALTPWCMAGGARRFAAGYERALLASAIVWAISAPIFFVIPTAYDGLYERILGLVSFSFVASLSLLLMREPAPETSQVTRSGQPSVLRGE